MRELKFRAWVKRSLYPDNMYWFNITWGNFYDGDGWIGMLPIGETDKKKRIQVDPGDIELMQYTGLKDKNGKEIYEGDILRYDNFRDWLISWHEAGFYLQNFFRGMGDADYFILTHDLAITREIIGNIYENPELLTKG